jgi:hypothetical protein
VGKFIFLDISDGLYEQIREHWGSGEIPWRDVLIAGIVAQRREADELAALRSEPTPLRPEPAPGLHT